MLTVAAIVFAGCKPDEPDNGGNNNGQNDTIVNEDLLNGHEFVDLGLPSGTLWATCNVGAETPEGYGDYFAWGETEPKTTYNWNTYQHCNGVLDQLTKYCNDSDYGYNGFTDDLTVLQPSDDAATANWGSGWCMPTADQWRELRDNTSAAWTTHNGVNGRLFAAPNGNSLFLPAAGDRWGDELLYVGEDGGYWSSSLGTHDTADPAGAWNFDLDGMCYDDRAIGLSVRAVCFSRQN